MSLSQSKGRRYFRPLDAQNGPKPAIRLSRKDWLPGVNGAVLSPIPGAERAQRSCPAGFIAEVGRRWCGRDAALNRTEDLNVKVCEEFINYIGGASACCNALAPNDWRAEEQED